MGKALLFLVATTTLTSGVLLYTGSQQSAFQAAEQLSEQEAQLAARQVAQTAMSEARTTFLADPDGLTGSTSYSGSYEGGSFETSLVPELGTAEPTIRIRVEGRMPHGNGKLATHTIETTYRLSGEGGAGSGGGVLTLPPFMRNVITANRLSNMNGSQTYALDAEGNVDPAGNASIRINSSPGNFNGNTIRGFLLYNDQNYSPSQWNLNQFRPNPESALAMQHAGPIDIQRFDPYIFRNMPGVHQHPHNQQNLNGGTVNLGGSPGNPAVWYFPQRLNMNGVKLDGYAIMISPNGFNMNGTVKGTPGTQIFMFSGDHINMNGSDFPLHLFSNNDINVNGSKWIGSITAHGNVNNVNGTSFYHAAPPADLVAPVFPVEEEPGEQAWRTTTYREWASVD